MAGRDEGDPDPLDVALGARIRTLRKARNMSQERLADAVGVTFQQVQKYERGSNRVSFSRLALIATALNSTLAELVGDLEDATGAGDPLTVNALMRTPGAPDLVAAYLALPDEPVRRGVLHLVQELARAAENRDGPQGSRPA